jgi:hypothetical protein
MNKFKASETVGPPINQVANGDKYILIRIKFVSPEFRHQQIKATMQVANEPYMPPGFAVNSLIHSVAPWFKYRGFTESLTLFEKRKSRINERGIKSVRALRLTSPAVRIASEK